MRDSSRYRGVMYFAIGFLLGLVWVFVNPYLFADSSDRVLLSSVTSPLGMVLLSGCGYLIDRTRRRSQRDQAGRSQ